MKFLVLTLALVIWSGVGCFSQPSKTEIGFARKQIPHETLTPVSESEIREPSGAQLQFSAELDLQEVVTIRREPGRLYHEAVRVEPKASNQSGFYHDSPRAMASEN
jgi:hypothetical protein